MKIPSPRRGKWLPLRLSLLFIGRFVAVKIDVKDPGAAAAAFERYPVGAWPTTYVTDAQGNVLAHAAGGLGKSEFLELLEKAATPR